MESNKLVVRRTFCLFFLFCLSILATPLYAQSHDPIELSHVTNKYQLNHNAYFLEESVYTQSIEQILKRRTEFRPVGSTNPNYGFSPKTLWLYHKVTNLTDHAAWTVNISFAQNDVVELFLVKQGEVVYSDKQGKHSKQQYHRYPVFPLQLDQGHDYEIFLRVHTPHQHKIVPIELSSHDELQFKISIDHILWGMYYGGLLMLLLYTMMLYVTRRDPNIIAYAVYICSAIFFELIWGGHLHHFIKSDLSRWLGQHTSLAFSFTTVTAGYFTLKYLEAASYALKVARFIKTVLFVVLGLSVMSALDLMHLGTQNTLIYITSIVAITSLMYAGFESYMNDFKPARYFIFAWGALLTSAMIGLLGLIGFLPSNAFTTYCFQVAVFFESALFAVALLEQKRYELEVDVKTVTDDLRNNMEYIEEQNVRLDIARKEALKASQIKSQFLANMSHEIRTPLNAILGFSKELSNLALPKEKQEHIQIINTSATNLLAIVNDVLDFSKIEAGKLEINKETFSPTELLEELVFLYAKTAAKKGLCFSFHRASLPEKLIGDPLRIKQVLTNLISNAIKFTEEGHITFYVKSEQRGTNKLQLTFEIEDSGIGILPNDKARLFKAFSQLDEALTRSYQGTGLGLVISQQLVNLMEGNISLNSLYGVGSTFKAQITCEIAAQTPDIAPNSIWYQKRIALFDTNHFTRKAKGLLFSGFGAKLTCIESLDFLEQQQDNFDYLVADIHCFSNEEDEVAVNRALDACRAFPCQDKILIYRNADELDELPELKPIFSRYVESPIPLSRIRTLLENNEEEDVNIWQQRLSSLPNINVLAVDDMELNLKLLKTWLADSPINLVFASSGQEALNLCEHVDFDMILMDVQMPDMDGVETTKRIRKTQVNKGTPVIAVTAHAFKEEKERLLNSGMDDYLSKPLDLGSLINTIKRWSVGAEEKPALVRSDLVDFDWAKAVEKANGNEEIANDLFFDFIEQLPQAYNDIDSAAKLADWPSLQHHIHRLHGASCYTGVPKLQYLCAECETLLKQGQPESATMCLPAIEETVKVLIQHKERV